MIGIETRTQERDQSMTHDLRDTATELTTASDLYAEIARANALADAEQEASEYRRTRRIRRPLFPRLFDSHGD